MKDAMSAATEAQIIETSKLWILLRFLRQRIALVAVTSIAVVVPCFWHPRIEAGDLGSHTYNVWLAQLISEGKAPGLYLVQQWNNVLLDLALTHLGSALGFTVAERIIVPLSVLIFFWGAFALISAFAGREPWYLTPGIAMVAYGWTLQMGFLNYYLSLGLAMFSLALIWQGRTADRFVGFVLAALVLLAHPIGLLWLAGSLIYIVLADWLFGRSRWILFSAAIVVILAIHFYIAHKYHAYDPVAWHFYLFSGPDQLVTYGQRYRRLAAAFLLLAVSWVLGSFPEWDDSAFWNRLRTPLELCLLTLFGTAMVWGGIQLPSYATGLTFLPQRLTTITAAMGLCVLGCVRPRMWHLAGLLGCGLVFFPWMYQDTGFLNRMEGQAQALVSKLPYGSRIIPTIWTPSGWRIGAEHIVDRACTGRCFSYSNYEPSSRQFRVRIEPAGSPIVVSSPVASLAMRDGTYVVQATDLPLAVIYQCDERDLGKLCIRDLSAGEATGRLGYHPPR
jgi:hypothetical protein